MCVTNIAKRRPDRLANESPLVSRTQSLISRRLMGNFSHLMQELSKPSTYSTHAMAGASCGLPQHHATTQCLQKQQESVRQQSIQYVNDAVADKPRPKRRRKPQKPGKTAKQNDRHFVVHRYHDHALDPDENDESQNQHQHENQQRRRGGVATCFPTKLHSILDQVERDGLAHVISWQPHGRCFLIHKPKEFADHVMPNYFRQSKITSFQRQLNLYGFARITRGQDSGSYYHELFLRGREFLCKQMTRTKIKGTRFKAASSPEQEPDFYSMPPVVVKRPSNEQHSGGEESQQQAFTPKVVDDFHGCDDLFDQATAFEPISVQLSPMPSLVPYPVLASAATNFAATSNFADSILDEAVDEIFRNDPLMEDTHEIDTIWDSTAFGQDLVQDDMQLGFLLERMLDE